MEPAPAPSRRLCSCVVRCCTVTGSAWISSEAEPHSSNRIHDDPELEAQEQIHDDPALEAQEQPPEERELAPAASRRTICSCVVRFVLPCTKRGSRTVTGSARISSEAEPHADGGAENAAHTAPLGSLSAAR